MLSMMTPKAFWLEPLMGGFHAAMVMLSNLVAYCALKYGIVVVPAHYHPGTETPYELISRLTVYVSEEEEAPFLYLFVVCPELEVAGGEVYQALQKYANDQADDVENPMLDVISTPVANIGKLWAVESVLVIDASPEQLENVDITDDLLESLKGLGIDGSKSASKVVSALQGLGYLLHDQEGEAQEQTTEDNQDASNNKASFSFMVAPEDEYIMLDEVLAAYLQVKPGAKRNPLTLARRKK